MLAKQLGLTQVIVELDASVVVHFLKTGLGVTHQCSSLVLDCIALVQEEGWVKEVRHIFREGNRCADFLANFAQNCSRGLTILQSPPADLGPLLALDKIGHPIMNEEITGYVPDRSSTMDYA